jgi:hypothetical protein
MITVSSSYPLLSIARATDSDYGDVLWFDELVRSHLCDASSDPRDLLVKNVHWVELANRRLSERAKIMIGERAEAEWRTEEESVS